KYKELISICNTYQDFTYIASFKQKLKELQNKVEKGKKIRREIESKKKFEVPGQIKFTNKVTVKPLPLDKSKIRPEITPKIPEKKAEELEIDEKKVGKLTLFKSSKEQVEEEDIEIDIKVTPTQLTSISQQDKTLSTQFSKQLQMLIEQRGSSLSLKLCEHLISELETSLGRTLTLEDIKTAADIFTKQENM
ncbi:MAG: hypothetical protein ACFFGP_04715, partial [Promethearchaeota archaeon]